MRRWLPHPILTPALTLIWLLLNGSLASGHVVLGLLLGWAIPALSRAFWPDRVRLRRPLTLLRFAATVLADIGLANLRVARLILARPRHLRPAFVIVALDVRDDLAIAVLANTICLTPGTVSAKISADKRHLLVHALDCTDAAALAATIKARYEAPLKEIFAC